jgi:hypothetical protein
MMNSVWVGERVEKLSMAMLMEYGWMSIVVGERVRRCSCELQLQRKW